MVIWWRNFLDRAIGAKRVKNVKYIQASKKQNLNISIDVIINEKQDVKNSPISHLVVYISEPPHFISIFLLISVSIVELVVSNICPGGGTALGRYNSVRAQRPLLKIKNGDWMKKHLEKICLYDNHQIIKFCLGLI